MPHGTNKPLGHPACSQQSGLVGVSRTLAPIRTRERGVDNTHAFERAGALVKPSLPAGRHLFVRSRHSHILGPIARFDQELVGDAVELVRLQLFSGLYPACQITDRINGVIVM